jgi:phage baseplate assembly protein W
MLQAKYGSIDPALRARIEAASLEQLLAWARRIVVVRTIEELFAN